MMQRPVNYREIFIFTLKYFDELREVTDNW